MNILVVAAHPDDEVLGCGGTIARLIEEGHRITICIMCMRGLGEQCRQVQEVLDAKGLFMYEMPDQQFDTVSLTVLIQIIESAIRACDPDAVYTHHTGDLNLDHAITARAVLTATRPKPGCLVKDVYMFEVPSSTEWGFNYQFKPNVFVDITDTFEKKLEAMRVYESEMRYPPHPRSPAAIEALAMYRGSTIGVLKAEAFELVRSIR